MQRFSLALTLCLLPTLLAACHSRPEQRMDFAIALHAGAGTIDKDTPPEQVREYTDSLAAALRLGRDMLAAGRSSLDTTEAVVMFLEDDPKFNAGRGAVFNADGRNDLDASIMDGATLKCGAVAGVTTVKNPIHLSRRVMEQTRHIILAGAGAEKFADTLGPDIVRVDPAYFFTQRRWDALIKTLKERGEPLPTPAPGVKLSDSHAASDQPAIDDRIKSTVGCVALDKAGNLAAATSTGGLTAKKFGRIGDSPIIGAGNYANNAACAASGTGSGEEFIRNGVTRDVSARMLYKHLSVEEAAKEVVFNVLKPDDGGVIAVSRTGEIALVFSTNGMFRAAADSKGRFEVGIWKALELSADPARP